MFISNYLKPFLTFSAISSHNLQMNHIQRKTIENTQSYKNLLLQERSIPDLHINPTKSLIGAGGSRNFQKYQIIVEKQHLNNELKLIQWRSKTQLPIVKVLFYKIQQKKLLDECSVVQVAIQNFCSNLNTLPKMTLSQIVYLLKQSLIGFERLYDKFGAFDVTNKMILVNKNNKCRVWINQNITLNFPTRRCIFSQRQFIKQILDLFSLKCFRSPLSQELFDYVGNVDKLIQGISNLEKFIQIHKITLSNRLNLVIEPLPYFSIKDTLKKEQINTASKIQNYGTSTFKKIPKFIQNLRGDRKINRDINCKSIDDILSKGDNKRDCSQLNKKVNNNYTPIKNDNYSPVSNYSPISAASYDPCKKKIQFQRQTSNLVKYQIKDIQKHASQRQLKKYPINFPKTPQKKNQIGNLKNCQKQQNNQFIYQKQQYKTPKSISFEIDLQLQNEFERILDSQPDKTDCNINSSQQTATTIHGSLTNTNDIQAISIFEKNGWMKRVNNLITQDINEIKKSHHQGKQIFSEQYVLAQEQLNLLGQMGKLVKQSIVQEY